MNGEDAVLDRILPLAAKYGAAVIGLTLDENGIPPKAEERFKIAEKILDRARSYGIKKEDVIIDCLVLTVSAEQKAALETLKAVRMVKERLGLPTFPSGCRTGSISTHPSSRWHSMQDLICRS